MDHLAQFDIRYACSLVSASRCYRVSNAVLNEDQAFL